MSFMVKAAFGRFDADGDGTIDKKEFTSVMNSLNGGEWDEEEIEAMMASVDKNKDGKVIVDELVDWIFAGGVETLKAQMGLGKFTGASDRGIWADESAKVFPAPVIMFSGCQDSQTSADVYNVSSFQIPEDAGPGGAGGACTTGLIKALSEQDDYTWSELLMRMRGILDGKYSQIPMLSSSRAMDLNTSFSVANQVEGSNNFKALLVGINYVGTKAELTGCHNDVETMYRFLRKQGYSSKRDPDHMRILMDDGERHEPTGENIRECMKWLTEGAKAGDSLFFHYSGHGASIKDDGDDEADGQDEALCPCDYSKHGCLRDDTTFSLLVGPLPEGVLLTCVLDCCHSGTILDLPYMFKADDAAAEVVANGNAEMQPNPIFDFNRLLAKGLKNAQADIAASAQSAAADAAASAQSAAADAMAAAKAWSPF